MMTLTRKDEDGNWLPASVDRLVDLLARKIESGRGVENIYAFRRNIAYNLQHIEFLDQCLADLKLTSVLTTQTWKTAIVVGCGILESVLHFLVVATGNQTTVDWESTQEFTGASKSLDGRTYRVDSIIKERLNTPKPVQMTFDALIKKAKDKKLLGDDPNTYAQLKRLRRLRNLVHLRQVAEATDHDYNAFSFADYALMMRVLQALFTGPTFSPTAEQLKLFQYLEKYVEASDN